ncbi:putative homoserine O-acetyltransferase [Candidatus Zinderia insecticola CARI]|uniref:Homoserine O-succinyltransferase n=1 Tax=Zinderia insecticola (strain CARI) TaxID=871271 RepID=E0TIP1_ZINIC|nr:putative homoserine O-acetyltransferase [Candidatus Zinderia insecticola CARI]
MFKNNKIKSIFFSKNTILNNNKILKKFIIIYRTFGKLNFNKSNIVLICHALNASHNITNENLKFKKKGWWYNMIWYNRSLDIKKFFIIGINNLGSCFGSTGPNNINYIKKKIFGYNFPKLNIEDWVKIQKMLLNKLNLKKISVVLGGSLGGMQAICWSILNYNRLKYCIIVATTIKLSINNIIFNNISKNSILYDTNFYNGNYYKYNIKPNKGLGIARMLGHFSYSSYYIFNKKFNNSLFNINYEIEKYFKYQSKKFIMNFDANTYLIITNILNNINIINNKKFYFKNDKNKICYLLISFTTDIRFPKKENFKIINRKIKNKKIINFINIKCPDGHDSFLSKNFFYIYIVNIFFKIIFKKI